MAQVKTARPDELNWAEFESSLPCEGVVRLHGAKKARLVARMREAFAAAKVGDTV